MDPSGDGGSGLTATGLFCGSCGIELPANSKFCNECGAPLTQATRSAEYKQVTVLFADVVHSMDIAAAVGAERLREIMTELVERSADAVERYGGTVDKFTGDGIMVVFGAPVSLEDHAVRACLAALGVQDEAKRLAEEVQDRDGVGLQLRVGLNSGQVIAGEIGSGALGYTAVGEQVGMAQRMESIAPSGGVMLSATTARLVDGAAALGEVELVHIKGADKPVSAQRLLGMEERHHPINRAESNLVGRRWELSAVEALLDRAVDGHGAVVGVVGPPGIGKSRLVQEVSAMASLRGIEVFTGFCESHTSQLPFYAVARLLRAATGAQDLDRQAARDRVRAQVTDADPEDLMLLDDLLAIADPDTALPKIDPDARWRRLTALVKAASLARQTPAVYVVEDAHWIDEASESMLAEFLTVIPQTRSLVLLTYRREYRGPLTQLLGAQTVALAPLSDSEATELIAELVGPDPTVGGLADRIADRAAGNPLFAEEIVRELAERGVLVGETGAYISRAEIGEITVPATLQATIAARIDRLDPAAKRTLGAGAVIGSRFSRGLLETLGIDPVLEDLVGGEFIDQITFTRQPEYVFHHPLIRSVAYESQLKSDRAELHRRVADAIQERDPESVDENMALIAEHLDAAGELRDAYSCHMLAGGWSNNRDIAAARVSWERARQIADALPDDDPDRTEMRIGPRTMLCATWRVHADISGHFEELRQLCTLADDNVSLAIGMTGVMMQHMHHGRVREASRLASEQTMLLKSIVEPSFETTDSFVAMVIVYQCVAINIKYETGALADILRWSQTVIDWADRRVEGSRTVRSSMAMALVWRGVARWSLGREAWHEDLDDAVAMARNTDSTIQAAVVGWKYGFAIANGVLRADDNTVRELDDALQVAEGSGDDYTLAGLKSAAGVALALRDAVADRQRGLELLGVVRDMCRHNRYIRSELPFIESYVARVEARRGDRDAAIPVMRKAVIDMLQEGQLAYGVSATTVLVETLLDRGADGDVAEAQNLIERLANLETEEGWVTHSIWLLRLRALLARAHGDETGYRDYRDRYRATATSLGFEGHIAWAEAMP